MSAIASPSDPSTLDIVSPDYYQQGGYPHAEWTWLRQHAPVRWYERSNFDPFWAITKQADHRSGG